MMAGIARSVVTIDQLANVIPIDPVHGTGMDCEREGSLPTGGAYIPDSGVTTEESVGRDDYVHIPFRRIVGDMDVDNLVNVMSDGQAAGKHRAKKIKATWRKVQNTMISGANVTSHSFGAGSPASIGAIGGTINYGPWLSSARRGPGTIKYTHAGTLWQFRAPGDVDFGDAVAAASNGTYTLRSFNRSKWIQVTITAATAVANAETSIYFSSSTNEFDGMNEILDPSMLVDVVGVNGDSFDISMLDAMLDMEKVDRNRAFIMSGKLLNKYYAAQRALGGTQPPTIQLAGYGQPVPTYRGYPILVNDFIPDETIGSGTTQSMYLASLDADEGLFLGAASYGGQAAIVDVDPRKRPVLGFQLETVGPLEGKDHNRERVKWIGALGLRSDLALVRKRGVVRT